MRRRKFWKRESSTSRRRKRSMRTKRKRSHLRGSRSLRLRRLSIKKEKMDPPISNLLDLKRRLLRLLLVKRVKKRVELRVLGQRAS
jgi:hypothetical protein